MPVPKNLKGDRRSTLKSDRDKEWRKGLIIFLIFAALSGGLLAFFVTIDQDSFELGEDLCPKDRGFRPPKVIVVLIDQTDQFRKDYQEILIKRLERWRYQEVESAPIQSSVQFARLELYSFRGKPGPEPLDITRHLSLCNPGEVTALTKFTKNPEQVSHQFNERFRKPLDDELRKLLEFKESPQSPILEALKYVAFTTFAEPRYKNAEKRLIIISDGIHNTPEIRMHGRLPRFSDFFRSPYGNRVLADLDDVHVLWLLVETQQAQQREIVRQFWTEYFQKAGAIDFNPIFIP